MCLSSQRDSLGFNVASVDTLTQATVWVRIQES